MAKSSSSSSSSSAKGATTDLDQREREFAERSQAADRKAEAALDAEVQGESSISDRPRRELPEEMEREIERRRQQNVLTATIAGLSWGQGMSTPIRRAFADYCARYDVDPITEMDCLGGQVYISAEWYLRTLGKLRVLGIVKDYTLEHIHADKRLEEMMTDERLTEEMRSQSRALWFEKATKRVQHNAPEEAAAICVCTIVLPHGSPIQGCKWAGNGTGIVQPRRGGGSAPNPVTEANPTLSVESQAIRRAVRQIMTHVTGKQVIAAALPHPDALEAELGELSERNIASLPQPSAESQLDPKAEVRPIRDVVMAADMSDPYGLQEPEPMRAMAAPKPPEPERVAAPQERAEQPSPSPEHMKCPACSEWVRPGKVEDHGIDCSIAEAMEEEEAGTLFGNPSLPS